VHRLTLSQVRTSNFIMSHRFHRSYPLISVVEIMR
jgi:hypothetical protein